jgi:tetratricopeptide (TPR) repeat protein
MGLFDRFKSDKAPTQEASAAAWVKKGAALVKSDRSQEALPCIDKALELDPKNVEALVNKGTALYALGGHEEAFQCCYRTLARDPKNAAAQELKRAVLNKSAAEVLGRIGEPAVEPLISALNDHDCGIREKAGAYWSRRRDCDRPPKTTPTARTAVPVILRCSFGVVLV